MAKTDSETTPRLGKARGGCRPILAAVSFVLSLLIFVSLVDYRPEQNRHHNTYPTGENIVGGFGAEAGHLLFHNFGGAGWLAPIALAYLAYIFFRCPRRFGFLKIAGIVVCIVSATGLLNMQDDFFTDQRFFSGPGGVVGNFLYVPIDPADETPLGADIARQAYQFHSVLRDPFGPFGSALILSLAFVVGFLLLLPTNAGDFIEDCSTNFTAWRKSRADRAEKRRQEKRKLREEKRAELELLRAEKEKERQQAKEKKDAGVEDAAASGTHLTEEIVAKPKKASPFFSRSAKDEVEAALPSTLMGGQAPVSQHGDISATDLRRQESAGNNAAPAITPPAQPPGQNHAASQTQSTSFGKNDPAAPRIFLAESPRKAIATHRPKHAGDYKFPPINLLSKPDEGVGEIRENHEDTARRLIHTLSTFGVEARVDEIHVGPVITRYDILPAPGTKVSKIQGLENDIAMGLKAMAVRIIAPVPGKGCVGVEVPNRQPQPVTLREIIESEAWVNSRAEIPIALGKDVSGEPLVADLTKMPHLLIAGSTGSGKTVCINSIIASLLYHSSPNRLRFIMVDPKIMEMKVYNDLPHMLIPVVTEPKKVPGALKWLLNEMTRRYQIFATIGVRNIAGFHDYQKKKEKDAREVETSPDDRDEIDSNIPEAVAPHVEVPRDDQIEIPRELPYIVCIIDELADLMMVAPAEIETGVARLAQLARAAGIHLILATQRPSVNVITGVIKANLPSRISFKVASKVDSRTILDGMGAEQLIGRGDMLFMPPGSARLIRSQGAFVSDDEINSIVEYLKRNGPPQFAEDVQRHIEAQEDEEEEIESSDADDELFQEALEVLRTTKRASTSMLQRRLRIGYNRAARIMEIMEQRGIVGPENGSNPREILMDLDSL